MQTQESNQVNTLVLANCCELVTNIIQDIAGNDIANSLKGASITKSTIHSLVGQRLVTNLKNSTN